MKSDITIGHFASHQPSKPEFHSPSPSPVSQEIQRLRDENKKMRAALQHVLNSCVHPETAVRAVMVDLKPIREALKI